MSVWGKTHRTNELQRMQNVDLIKKTSLRSQEEKREKRKRYPCLVLALQCKQIQYTVFLQLRTGVVLFWLRNGKSRAIPLLLICPRAWACHAYEMLHSDQQVPMTRAVLAYARILRWVSCSRSLRLRRRLTSSLCRPSNFHAMQ